MRSHRIIGVRSTRESSMPSLPSAFRLSVVIPTYNRRELVLRAVLSVLDQTGAESVEIIVADDGSTDGTIAAVAERFGADPRVRVSATQRGYACAARNAGFVMATGDFVCFLDSDDIWLPGTLATIAAVFAAHPELAFVSVDGNTFEKPGQKGIARVVAADSPGWTHADFTHVVLQSHAITLPSGNSAHVRSGDFFPAIILGDLFYLSGLVARRDAVIGAGPFNERFRYFNDWEFFARLCLQGPGTYIDCTGFRRDTGRADQISRGKPISAMARRRRFILHSLPRKFPAKVEAYRRQCVRANADAIYFMARCLVRSMHRRWARRYLWRCLRDGYKPVRSLALLARTYTGV
jgi:glycosyltransferase involved in cell wall biosynthesis